MYRDQKREEKKVIMDQLKGQAKELRQEAKEARKQLKEDKKEQMIALMATNPLETNEEKTPHDEEEIGELKKELN